MSQPNAPAIVLSEVSKAYPGPAGAAFALSAIDLQVQPGEAVAIVGRSGSGKSTLINLISGIDRATQGEVHIAGVAVHSLNESATAIWRGRSLGVVFQFFQLLPTLTVLENVLLPMEFARTVPIADRERRAQELLTTLGVAGHAHKFPHQLSGGEQQRVAVARALANDPPVIVADEPTGNLDSGNSAEVMKLLTALAGVGLAGVGLTSTGLTSTGLTSTGLTSTGLTSTELASTGLTSTELASTGLTSTELASTGLTSTARRTVIVATHDQELLPLFSRVITLRDGRIVSDQPTATSHA